jgi:Zn-dependent protease with chaperone function
MPREPTSENPSTVRGTPADSAEVGVGSSGGNSGQHHPAVPRSLWIDLYRLLLLAILLAYFVLMFAFAGELFRWSAQFMRQVGADLGAANYLWAGLHLLTAAVLIFLLLRTVRHLIHASVGLVTTVHDEVPEATEGIALSAEKYPRVFELIEDVGRKVGSPMPDVIRVTSAPESFTVELRRFGFSPQRRLVLVLSLPQLEVLSVGELCCILGHELSHFGKGDTRLTVFLSRFLRALQRSIESIGHQWWHWVDPIYWFQRLYFRMFAALSAPIERHQELRADCISAEAFGGELAARTLLKDWLLTHQFLTAEASYDPAAGNGKDSDTVFSWFRQRWHDFSVGGQDYLLRRLQTEERTSFWDPDPAISERVQMMRGFPAKELQPSQPARVLVDDFPALEKQLHEEVYG